MTIARAAARVTWRTPLVILLCGCVIATLGFGPRSSLGLFLTPMSNEHGWGRDIFALAMAIQVLMWGVGQPLAGAIADRFGTALVRRALSLALALPDAPSALCLRLSAS
jgi:MFS family permease